MCSFLYFSKRILLEIQTHRVKNKTCSIFIKINITLKEKSSHKIKYSKPFKHGRLATLSAKANTTGKILAITSSGPDD